LARTHANDSANQVRSIMALMSRDTLSLDAMAGAVLEDKYKLIRVLGSGAMAHVYEAEQLRLGRSVAVKIMRVALVSDKRSVERFRRSEERRVGKRGEVGVGGVIEIK